MIFALGSLAAGGALAAYGKYEENRKAQRLLDLKGKILNKQGVFINKNQDLETAVEESQMKEQSLQTTIQSKNAAIQGFEQKSAAQANTGTSGTIGGSSFFNLGKAIVAERENNRDTNALGADQMNITENQFRLNALNFDQQRSNLSDQKELLSFDQEAQDYANSPLSYGLSIGAGALNGLAVGSSFLSAADTLSSFAAPAATQAFASPNSKTQTTMWDPKGGSLFGQNSLLAPKVPVGTSGWAGTTGDFSGAQNFGTLQGFDLNGSSNLWQSPLLTKLRKTKSLLGGL